MEYFKKIYTLYTQKWVFVLEPITKYVKYLVKYRYNQNIKIYQHAI